MAGLIDVHHHFLPAAYCEAVDRAGLDPPDGMPRLPNWSEDEALRFLDTTGIETAYLTISSPGVTLEGTEAAHLAANVQRRGGGADRAPSGSVRQLRGTAAARRRREPRRGRPCARRPRPQWHRRAHASRRRLPRRPVSRSGLRRAQPTQGDRVHPPDHATVLRGRVPRCPPADHRVHLRHRAGGDEFRSTPARSTVARTSPGSSPTAEARCRRSVPASTGCT